MGQALERDLLPLCPRFAVIAVGVDRDAAARGELAPDLDVLGIHQADQILHDDVDAVLMEVAVVAEAEQIQLERLALHHARAGHIGDIDGGEVRLAGHRAQAGELRAVELDEIIVFRMLVGEGLEQFGRVVGRIGHLLGAQNQ